MTSDRASATSVTPAWRRSLVLVLSGVPGVLSLWLVLPELPGVAPATLLLQPALLLAIAAFAGSRLAARAGLCLASGVPAANRAGQVATGGLLGLAIAAADHGLRGLWQAAPGLPPSIIEAWSVGALIVGLLYGGVVEEVAFRWFVMSFLVIGLAQGVAHFCARPPRWIMPAAAIGAAALFAASHLPILAMAGPPPEAAAVVRTLMLNAIAGVVFGMLFARRDLVAAMLAHGGAHLGFAAAALAAEAWP